MNRMKKQSEIKTQLLIFWLLMFCGAVIVLSQIGYSDGDDAFFYQYTNQMGFFEYLTWRYETWVGRMSGEALVWITFHQNLWFWRGINAVMLILLPMGILRLICKTLGYTGFLDYLERTPFHNLVTTLKYPVAMLAGYLLMSVMTLGYAAIWMNGSIFYTWTFTFGVWAMMPLADLVYETGKFSRKQLLYAIPFSIIATMSIEQMGAVLLAFEVLAILAVFLQKKRNEPALWIQFAITLAAFFVLFHAPGNDIRVATEITHWIPGYEDMSVGQHIFITLQWLVSSFANEGKAIFITLWLMSICVLWNSSDFKKTETSGKNRTIWVIVTGLFIVIALLPYIGVTLFSEMGLGGMDITVLQSEIPSWAVMTLQNKVAFFWWIAAILFTVLLLWKATRHSYFMMLVFLGGLASEAILFFSPTIYSSGARVYYLTDLMYLFLILRMGMQLKDEKKERMMAGCICFLGIINFLSQLSILMERI